MIGRLRRSLRLWREERAEARTRRRVELRSDYRTFSTSNQSWGNAVTWLTRHERAQIFGLLPRRGDLLVDGAWLYLIVAVETFRDPGDQHFVDVRLLGAKATYDLPERVSTPADDYIW